MLHAVIKIDQSATRRPAHTLPVLNNLVFYKLTYREFDVIQNYGKALQTYRQRNL
jgi:hypothetical protein